ncbi:hypothetical protein VIGAN_01032300 [Vigna angularis var. angularis]|uniref:Uncharacterized protein n=1 Tax=Vigna angularis var. angularis TaxID=157739 RepID=A0A0S3QX23_PHAAN|nr:hypothetical protein VIGAN_01032300 [Vigna angularis var. angularis]
MGWKELLSRIKEEDRGEEVNKSTTPARPLVAIGAAACGLVKVNGVLWLNPKHRFWNGARMMQVDLLGCRQPFFFPLTLVTI